MYAQFNEQIENVIQKSMFPAHRGDVWAISYRDSVVMMAEHYNDGVIVLETIDGRYNRIFYCYEVSLDYILKHARDMLDNYLYNHEISP